MRKVLFAAKILVPLFGCFWFGSFITNKLDYEIWYYSQPAGFSKQEASALVGKKVKSLCDIGGSLRAEDKGKVVSIEYTDFDGQWNVVVDWGYLWRGGNVTMWSDKQSFEGCIVEIKNIEP